ncbi:unnamed protein product [Dibothriocephalus latus]|uniref:Uncharacterized protein n=1 Tax=Dibothriocephalus latus TaxID=60516 RepID=A0A3P7PW83_DIBLA|nr:unnamed protein product [Dibothriocephalus latus]
MTCRGGRGYLKDLRSLYLNIGDSTNEQASISSVCGGKLEILLTPSEDNRFRQLSAYSARDPLPHTNFSFKYYPNGGCICLSIMDDWNSCCSFLDVIKAVLFLLANPNFDSANNSFGYLSAEYRDSFEEVCRQFLAGFPIKGEVYPANEKWCEWARANNCFPVSKRNQSGDESPPPIQFTPDVSGPFIFHIPTFCSLSVSFTDSDSRLGLSSCACVKYS